MRKPCMRRPSSLALAAVLGTTCFDASAQKSPALDRVSLWVGGYYASNDTDLNVGGRRAYAGVNGKLDFESDLGLERHSTNPRLRADFLLGDSQGFSFDYYQIHRNRTSDYSQPIPALGTDARARIEGDVDYDFGSAAYKWWFGHASDVFGVGLGAAYYKVNFRVRGDARAAGQDASASVGYDDSEWAPVLTLGWRHAFNDQWRLYVDASGVKKSGGNVSGHIWNGSLGVEWFPWRNVGFGLEYAASRLHLTKNYRNARAKLNLDSDGPAFYLRARF